MTEEEEQTVLSGSSTRGKVVKKAKRTVTRDNWSAREEEDCLKDANQLKKDLVSSLKYRQKLCIAEPLLLLSRCRDLTQIICCFEGKGSFSKVRLAKYGDGSSFAALVEYFSGLPHVNSDLQVDKVLAPMMFDQIKNAIRSTI